MLYRNVYVKPDGKHIFGKLKHDNAEKARRIASKRPYLANSQYVGPARFEQVTSLVAPTDSTTL